MPVSLNWFGDDVLAKLKKLQAQNLTRAAIHLSRRVKENLSKSGRQTGIAESDVSKGSVTRIDKDERGRRQLTVNQGEFSRIADVRNAARLERVRKKLERNKLSNKFKAAFKKDKATIKKLGKKFKKLFPKKRRRRKK